MRTQRIKMRHVDAATGRRAAEAQEAAAAADDLASQVVQGVNAHGQKMYGEERRAASEMTLVAEAEMSEAKDMVSEMRAQGREIVLAERARAQTDAQEATQRFEAD